MSGGSTEAFTSDFSLATELIFLRIGRLHPRKLSWPWKNFFLFCLFFNQSRFVPRSCRNVVLVADLCAGLWTLQWFKPHLNPTSGSKVMGDSLFCCCTKGWTEIIFLLFGLHKNCCNSWSTRTFCTIQDGNLAYKLCSTRTARQICERLGRWTSDSTDSLISSNLLLYSFLWVALWQLVMRLLLLATLIWQNPLVLQKV